MQGSRRRPGVVQLAPLDRGFIIEAGVSGGSRRLLGYSEETVPPPGVGRQRGPALQTTTQVSPVPHIPFWHEALQTPWQVELSSWHCSEMSHASPDPHSSNRQASPLCFGLQAVEGRATANKAGITQKTNRNRAHVMVDFCISVEWFIPPELQWGPWCARIVRIPGRVSE